MSRQRRRRFSDLYWELIDNEPPTPTPEELAELKDALLNDALSVRESLKYAVKILRRDNARLNAALEESDEEREARREKERLRKAEYRERVSQMSQMSQMGQNGTNGTERDKTGQVGQSGQVSAVVPSVPPTNQLTNLLTNQPKRERGGQAASHRAAFAAPSLEEVQALIRERHYHFDPMAFIGFYESKGWKVGNASMKSWKGACATWESRWRAEHPDFDERAEAIEAEPPKVWDMH